ncbi:MAG: 16S rRNA (adenine(1518)-N(6)/adenine(1519)-N(6))-dimethyltransferase RsmA [Thermaerobacter sp.]|nr:16S rRNA (adenine(1518)-N(6)/adenine(1519)-N(6))-dimethyltransferase RsmA [Thermaerobacter sp.]
MEPKLTSPSVVRGILDELGLRPLKRLGQHFLVDFNARERIVAALELQPGDRVLEIGPGLGALTQRLVELCDDVRAIEIDRALAAYLRDRFGARLQLHEGDALEADFRELLGPAGKLVGNLPYYISTALVVRILEAAPPLAVLMLQSEVALRLSAPPGSPERGALSVLREYAADIDSVTRVGAGLFYPPPQVGSQVIRLRAHAARTTSPWTAIRPVVQAAFGYRRKTLERALEEGLGVDRERGRTALLAADIDPKRRGETLSLGEFDRLAGALGAPASD